MCTALTVITSVLRRDVRRARARAQVRADPHLHALRVGDGGVFRDL